MASGNGGLRRGPESHLYECAQPPQPRWRQQPSNTPIGSPAGLGNRKLHDVDQERLVRRLSWSHSSRNVARSRSAGVAHGWGWAACLSLLLMIIVLPELLQRHEHRRCPAGRLGHDFRT